LPTTVQRDLLGADEIGGLDDAGPRLLESGMFAHFGAGDGRPDPKAVGGLLDTAQLVDALDVDDQLGLDVAALHAGEKVGAACQHEGRALLCREQCAGVR
jgi:hypothetical protein